MMLRWISSVPPAMLDWKLFNTIRWSSAPPSSVGSHATEPGPANSSAISRTFQAMFDPKSLPSEPPGPGVLPALSSSRVFIATSDLHVSIDQIFII